MNTTTKEDEKTDHDGAETRAESLVVVASTTPFGETILEEVIVSLALRATEDVCHYAETSKASRSFLAESIDLLLRRLLVLVDMDGGLVSLLGLLDWWGGVVGSDETLTGLVGVQDTGLLLVGSIDGVKACVVLYTKERVESSVASLMLSDLILETENFMVCQLASVLMNAMQSRPKRLGLTFRRPSADEGNQAQEQKQDRTLETGHGCDCDECVGLQRNVMELQERQKCLD